MMANLSVSQCVYVPRVGLEPTRPKTEDLQSPAPANYATGVLRGQYTDDARNTNLMNLRDGDYNIAKPSDIILYIDVKRCNYEWLRKFLCDLSIIPV